MDLIVWWWRQDPSEGGGIRVTAAVTVALGRSKPPFEGYKDCIDAMEELQVKVLCTPGHHAKCSYSRYRFLVGRDSLLSSYSVNYLPIQPTTLSAY